MKTFISALLLLSASLTCAAKDFGKVNLLPRLCSGGDVAQPNFGGPGSYKCTDTNTWNWVPPRKLVGDLRIEGDLILPDSNYMISNLGFYVGPDVNSAIARMDGNGNIFAAAGFISGSLSAGSLSGPFTGQVTLSTPGTKPDCGEAYRGVFWFTAAGSGNADTVEVCMKDDSEAYAWHSLL